MLAKKSKETIKGKDFQVGMREQNTKDSNL